MHIPPFSPPTHSFARFDVGRFINAMKWAMGNDTGSLQSIKQHDVFVFCVLVSLLSMLPRCSIYISRKIENTTVSWPSIRTLPSSVMRLALYSNSLRRQVPSCLGKGHISICPVCSWSPSMTLSQHGSLHSYHFLSVWTHCWPLVSLLSQGYSPTTSKLSPGRSRQRNLAPHLAWLLCILLTLQRRMSLQGDRIIFRTVFAFVDCVLVSILDLLMSWIDWSEGILDGFLSW